MIMTKLSNYTRPQKPSDEQKPKAQNENKKNVSEKDIMEKYNEYKDLSASQLNDELFKEVAKQKQDGSFNYAQLENMVESLKGSLSPENYQNMKRILESLK